MNILKNIFITAGALAFSASLFAQNGSSSSYSRFGLGTLTEQSQSFNRGMGGVAYGLRDGVRVNMFNPASYSCIDSLTFLFDIGLSFEAGHMSTPMASTNVRSAKLTNVNAGFRVAKNLGMSFGFVPYSTIGYSFSSQGTVGDSYISTTPITTKTSYTGSGGMRQLYLGIGWKPFGNLSIGVNGSYLWGDYQHVIAQGFYEGSATTSSNYSSQNLLYSADISSYKLDFGLQYPIRITKDDWVTIGATYGLGHSMNGDASMLQYTSSGDSTEVVANKAFDLPHSFGGGLAWQHKNKLLIAADASYEKWADCKSPIATKLADGTTEYTSQTGAYLNRTKVAVGAEYTPKGKGKANTYWESIRYRAGINYSTPYQRVNGQDGPVEMGASIGFGLPLSTKRMSGRSVINVSAEWKQRKPSASHMIKENYFLLNIGVTFNENWFSQWMFD